MTISFYKSLCGALIPPLKMLSLQQSRRLSPRRLQALVLVRSCLAFQCRTTSGTADVAMLSLCFHAVRIHPSAAHTTLNSTTQTHGFAAHELGPLIDSQSD